MERLFAIIFVIIGIANFVMKQQREQNRQQGGAKKQQPVYKEQPDYKIQPPRKPVIDKKPVMEMEDFRNEGMKSFTESEGLEAEDRNRIGSMDYIEQSQSREGECDEHPEHRRNKRMEQNKKPAPSMEVKDTEHESMALDLTEDNLISSIIMSEVLGPPRSLKRSIR